MILLVSSVIFVLVCIFAVVAVYFRKYLIGVIPLMFLFLFVLDMFIPNYVGYALESKFVNGQEATVLDVEEGKDWIYLTVQMKDDKEPRLIKMINTKENKKQADDAKEKSKQGVTVIKFGADEHGTGAGDGAGEGGSNMKILALPESEILDKPQ